MNYLKKLNLLVFNLLLLILIMSPRGAFANTATPATFFNDQYLRMMIQNELTPGLDVASISFQRSSGDFKDQLQAAAHQDFDDLLREKAEELKLPTHIHEFLNSKMDSLDSYSFLVRNCLIRRDDCGKDMFDIVVETKAGQGMNGIQYQCDTELVIIEGRSRRLAILGDIQGDIQLKISDCKLLNADITETHLVTSATLAKPSLASLPRSGYKPGSLTTVSLNQQVDFLRGVESFDKHYVDIESDGVGNAEVFEEPIDSQQQYSQQAPQNIFPDKPKPSNEQMSAQKDTNELDLNELMGGNISNPSTEVSQASRSLARYCEINHEGLIHTCFIEKPNNKVGSRCECQYPAGISGRSRL